MNNTLKLVAAWALILIPFYSRSQVDDMQRVMDSIEKASSPPKEFVMATFKTTRVINLQTIETAGRHTLDYRIEHRFGDMNSGSNNAWGIDGPANLFMSIEYSYDGRLMVGLGRSSLDKLAEGFLKFRLLRQQTNGNMPLSVTLFSSANYTAVIDPNKSSGVDKYGYFWDRFSFAHMMIIGRKFSKRLSFEIAPVMIHYNIVDLARDKNDMYALGFAGRCKITNRMAISAEYVLRLNKYSDNFNSYHDCAGIGLDIETGGHVFQILFTNAFGINEVQFVPYTRTSWTDFGIRLGFNLSRVFTVGGHE